MNTVTTSRDSLLKLVVSVARDRANKTLTHAEAEKHLQNIERNVQNERANAVPNYYDVKEYFT